MLKKYVLTTAAAIACSGLALAAQAPATTTSQPSTTAQTQTADASKPSATFTGCVYQETDVPRAFAERG